MKIMNNAHTFSIRVIDAFYTFIFIELNKISIIHLDSSHLDSGREFNIHYYRIKEQCNHIYNAFRYAEIKLSSNLLISRSI